ncbi:hypothetical protein [Streptomyces sp. 2231.1]|uniref:hypothetical protein n=1 Tax=Streptomyces sp. 2231.1 TaxID=1855347 RepID=UPI00115FE3A0|nr:hypothetical protein [Streptomyces sp. 2231.1]
MIVQPSSQVVAARSVHLKNCGELAAALCVPGPAEQQELNEVLVEFQHRSWQFGSGIVADDQAERRQQG